MNVTLIRHAYLPDATLGRLYAGTLNLATLEEPWRPDPHGPGGQRRENGLRESCIPDGTYDLLPHTGTRFKNVYVLENPLLGVYRYSTPVDQPWGRSAILIHSGNDLSHTSGCLLVGLRHNGHTVEASQTAIDRLRAVLGMGRHQLTIRPLAGTSEAA